MAGRLVRMPEEELENYGYMIQEAFDKLKKFADQQPEIDEAIAYLDDVLDRFEAVFDLLDLEQPEARPVTVSPIALPASSVRESA